MREEAWLASEDPVYMLNEVRLKITDRQLRLFMVGAVRQSWQLLIDGRTTAAVEVAEQFADGLADLDALDLAEGRALAALRHKNVQEEVAVWTASYAAALTTKPTISRFIDVNSVRDATSRKEVAAVLRDVAGDLVAADNFSARFKIRECDSCRGLGQEWVSSGGEDDCDAVVCAKCDGSGRLGGDKAAWVTQDVLRVAREAYECRSDTDGRLDPVAVSVLADAVCDADCDEGRVVAHLRSGCKHFRGCWVLDLILGKN